MLKILAIIVYFWNVENYFAPGEFPGHAWNKPRFYTKCNAVAKTLLLASDEMGALPDVVGFAEVGDASVLKALLGATPLRKLDYSFVHYDSPDRRGIDCALLYRRSRFRLLNSKPCHLYDSTGAIMPTRDILLAVLVGREDGDTLAVLVNHHPSKVGSGSDDRRRLAMDRLRFLADSLHAAGVPHIIAVGDFNDAVVTAPGIERTPRKQAPLGTIKFQGKWEKIDGCPLLEGLRAEERIFAPPCLLVRDSYGGEKPRRTFSGPRYLGGISDHLPVMWKVYKN